MTTLRTALPVSGLGCGGGARLTLEHLLRHRPGVLAAYVNPATEMAYVEYDPAYTSPEALLGVVLDSGFAPADQHVLLGSGPRGNSASQNSRRDP